MRKQLIAGAAALIMTAAGAGAANATVFAGTATFTDQTTGNALTVLANPNPASFTTQNLTAGGSQYFTGFMTLTTKDTASGNGFCSLFGCTGVTNTDKVSLTFVFSQPSTANNTTTIGGEVSETTFSLAPSLDNGKLTWTADNFSDQNGTYAKQIVSFANGAMAEIDVYDTWLTGTTSSLAAQFDMRIKDIKDPTRVPEPMSLALLGGGMLGVGAIRRRKGRTLTAA